MKKNILFGALLLAAGFVSCSDDLNEAFDGGAASNTLKVILPEFIPENGTRMMLDENHIPVKFTQGDLIGVYYQDNDVAVSSTFAYGRTPDDISNAAFFTSNGFVMNPDSKYYVLYPSNELATPKETNFYFPAYNMFAEVETDAKGNAIAELKPVFAMVNLNISVPTGFYKSAVMTLTDGTPIVNGIKMDLTTQQKEVASTTKQLQIGGVSPYQVTLGQINTYIPMAPQDLSSKTLEFTITDEQDNVIKLQVTGKNFEAGHIYNIAGEVEDKTVSEATVTRLYETLMKDLNSMEGGTWSSGLTSLANWFFGDVLGGDASKGSIDADQPDMELLQHFNFGTESTGNITSSKWTSYARAMGDANALISAANDNPKFSKELAEAKFIRALYGFDMLKIFGAATPYPMENDYSAGDIYYSPGIMKNMTGGSYIYIWDKIEADLKAAINDLPDTSTGFQHITKWAAKALLAKLYTFWASPYDGTNGAGVTAHWADAKVLLDEIINSGRFGLVDDYASIFTPAGDNSKECVFEIEYTTANGDWKEAVLLGGNIAASGIVPGTWGFNAPTYELANSFIVDENGLPLADYQNVAPLSTFAEYGSGWVTGGLERYVDPRLDVTVGRYGVEYWDYGRITNNSFSSAIRDYRNVSPYVSKKYAPMQSENGVISSVIMASEKNMHVIRYAEVLLMAAECAINMGDLTSARTYINKVRERAAKSFVQDAGSGYVMEDLTSGSLVEKGDAAANYRVGLYPAFASKDEAVNALEREYRLEFGMEGHRWFDLVRWGKAANVLNEFAAYEKNLIDIRNFSTYQNNWICLPIPTQILSRYTHLEQNPTWK